MRWIYLVPMLVGACAEPEWEPVSLDPYPNPFGPSDPLWSAQPHRDNPLEVAATAEHWWVTLQGSNDEPGNRVVAVEKSTGALEHIEVGSSPTGVAVHPDGRMVVVFNRFSNFVSVIDAETLAPGAQIETDFYGVEGVFSPDGSELWFTNRWRDALMVWDVSVDGAELVVHGQSEWIDVGDNPRDLAISADGKWVAVAALTGMDVTVVEAAKRKVHAKVDLGAPANDVVFSGDHLIVATTSASTHHLPYDGPDTNHDGEPGDGTPNVNFQDLQNELAVVDPIRGEVVHRYTSDSLCCEDYRDVDPADLARHGDLLAPVDDWIVGGALPEQLASGTDASGPFVVVTYSASNEFQRFDVATDGALTAGEVFGTSNHNPHGVLVEGDDVIVVHRLGETVGRYDLGTGELQSEITVGDLFGGAFPATDAEIGELFNFVTAPFTVDGDQSCTHCHREGGNIDKAFSMPLTQYAGVGLRMTMAYRGAADTRPWFMESAFDESNFKPVMNEFSRIENFCCTDYTLWPSGPPEDCEVNPPQQCDGANAGSLDGFNAVRDAGEVTHLRPTTAPTRDVFYEQRAGEVIGRTKSFGDGVFWEDPILETRTPVDLDFQGITRALGLFLLSDTNLLPNPNRLDSDQAMRGRALFESSETGCSSCHPSPTFAVSTSNNPFDMPLRMGPVVSPNRDQDGTNLDLYAMGFVQTFPTSEMDVCEDVCGAEVCLDEPQVCDDVRDVYFGVPSLRGLWDRADSMLHDGRADGLLEVLATPGHPALPPRGRGCNERDGVIDSHGATSHLSASELADLVAYIEAL